MTTIPKSVFKLTPAENEVKHCSQCGTITPWDEELGIKVFCQECWDQMPESDRRAYMRTYYLINRETILKKRQTHYQNSRRIFIERAITWNKKYRSRYNDYMREYMRELRQR